MKSMLQTGFQSSTLKSFYFINDIYIYIYFFLLSYMLVKDNILNMMRNFYIYLVWIWLYVILLS